jgi:hypothetical protein
MELFFIFLITRLTDLKGALTWLFVVSGILAVAALAGRVATESFTEAKVKDRPAEDASTDGDVYIYQGARRVTSGGFKVFLPVFILAFVVNLFLPNTRDAVVIAGGYGLVEAVKNERVQRLFGKSANVASQWLDEQLNGEKKDLKPESAAPDEKPAAEEKSEK